MTEPNPSSRHHSTCLAGAPVRALTKAFYDAMERDEPELTALHRRNELGDAEVREEEIW